MLNNIVAQLGTGAGGGGGAFESIATYNPSSTNSVTFSSLPSGYDIYQIRLAAATSQSGTSALAIQLNSDTGANYTYHKLLGNGASVTASGSTATNSDAAGFMTVVPGTNASNTTGVAIIEIMNPNSTSQNKTIRVFHGSDLNGSGTIGLVSQLWTSTSAITSIKIFDINSQFATGSKIALYGIKGS